MSNKLIDRHDTAYQLYEIASELNKLIFEFRNGDADSDALRSLADGFSDQVYFLMDQYDRRQRNGGQRRHQKVFGGT